MLDNFQSERSDTLRKSAMGDEVDALKENVDGFAGMALKDKLDHARTELLDLSTRNRLINTPRSTKAKQIEVIDELTSEIFRLLVSEGRGLTFAAGRRATKAADDNSDATDDAGESDEISDLAQPDDEPLNERGVALRHSDTKLQTRLTSEGLQNRLLTLYYDARTLQEEQGVNILFLALGMLKWFEDDKSDVERCAPLILLPVSLERGTAGERFKLRWLQEDPTPNLSLGALMRRQFGLELPEFTEGDDAFDPANYLARVTTAVSGQPRWRVAGDDIILGLFSFAKFLMYRDLDPELWPTGVGIADSPIIAGLLGDGFQPVEGLIHDDESIDRHVAPESLIHVVDADSSQTVAVHETRGGRNLVIQGPPGTGKSQTIANAIASAVFDGKRVLFVAEKMAALEVVKRRLDASGVGDICLELHSNKTNKRNLLEELRRTWDLGKPGGADDGSLLRQIRQNRDWLNGHVARLHYRRSPCGLTPFQVIGHLVRLRQSGQKPAQTRLTAPEIWSKPERDERELLLKDLAGRIQDIGAPAAHPWCGAGIAAITPMDLDRLVGRLRQWSDALRHFIARCDDLATMLGVTPPPAFAAVPVLTDLANRVAVAPEFDRSTIVEPCWTEETGRIEQVIATGMRLHDLMTALSGVVTDNARDQDIDAAKPQQALYGAGWLWCLDPAFENLCASFDGLIQDVENLQTTLTISLPLTFNGIDQLLALTNRLACAPNHDPAGVSSDVWRDQIADIADLVANGQNFAAIGQELQSVFSDAAWDTDVRQARQHLAQHATSMLRIFSGDYKRAKLLVSSIATGELPKSVEEQLRLLDRLTAGQKAASAVAADDALGRQAFGSLWRREKSDWAALDGILGWIRENGNGQRADDIRRIAGRLNYSSLEALARRIADTRRRLEEAASQLLDDLRVEAPGAFPPEPVVDTDLPALAARLGLLNVAASRLSAIFASPPDDARNQRRALEMLQEAQSAGRELDRGDNGDGISFGQRAFGALWNGEQSNWDELKRIVDWAKGNGSPEQTAAIHRIAAGIQDKATIGTDADTLGRALPVLMSSVEKEFAYLQFGAAKVFGTADVAQIDLRQLADRIDLWIERAEDLTKWTAFTAKAVQARRAGLAELVERMEDGRLNAGSVVPEFEMAYYEALYTVMVREEPELARFDGDGHARTVAEFGRLDRRRIDLARREVAAAHHQRFPRQDGGAGPVGVLKGEIVKRRNHLPIRQLMKRAGPAIQALKPVFMMSPLSVAQFLEPGSVTFDMLVIDEASQIQPVDAIGAIARCKQIVVVGDDRQLPPTRFFDKMIAGVEDDNDDATTKVTDVESVLGLCVSKGLPQRMLRWHYRSRHQSLIAVSNSQFYENKLFIVPSPYTAEAGMGLRFHHLPHATYDSGGTAANVEEAKEVAVAVIRHAREYPNLSLGVAAFSAKQRRALMDEVERLRRLNPDTEPFFSAHPAEPFFVKNLENVQGDERDVIFISVGYGRNAQGFMSMSFGPLNRDGGERRLNVLISRAKRRCEVFSSITDDDIDLERAKGKGVFAFKMFLHFARTGHLSFGHRSERDHDSVFEEQVANALTAAGYNVHAQVGLAGFFIDLAVSDFDRPGRYILGIECDGAPYHSSRSARDRDRLRQAVLEDHGWIIHRIWSTDWFHRPQQQLAKVIAAIEAAKEELEAREGKAASYAQAVPIEIVTVERENVTEIGLQPLNTVGNGETANPLSEPYREAALDIPREYELHDVPTGLMADLVRRIVEIEGPVHGDEIVARLRDLWGLQRAGTRIRPAVSRGLDAAVKAGSLTSSGDFFHAPEGTVTVRDRSNVTSSGLRKPEMLPPSEIHEAAIRFIGVHLGATPDETIVGVSRLFGFKATSAQLKQTIADVLSAAENAGALTRQGDLLMVNGAA